MFGMSLEKLVLVMLIAALLIGPTRLPDYARGLAHVIRSARGHVDAATARLEKDTGLSREQWNPEEWRRYDPRAIVRSALRDTPAPALTTRADSATAEPVPADAGHSTPPDGATPPALWPDALSAPDILDRIRPGQRFVVVGSSAHPTRVALADLPEDHPARRAATVDHEQASVTDIDPGGATEQTRSADELTRYPRSSDITE